MKEVLYYPSFFVEDEKWLKFALLYIDKLVTIIPSQANIKFSDMQSTILYETNLLNSHSPTELEVNFAAESLGHEIARLSLNPLYGNGQISRQWRDKGDFNSEIYNGKMSWKLQNMLLENEWAMPSESGLIVNDDLAGAYMTLLANVIAEQRHIPTITDKSTPVNFPSLDRTLNRTVNGARSVKTLINEIDINLPRDIDDISVEEIIEFRNNPTNRRNLNELHEAIFRISEISNSNISEMDMLYIKKNLFDAKRQYISSLAEQFMLGSGSILGIYQLVSGDAPYLDFLREVLGFSAISGIRSAYGNISELRRNRRAINYISDIENLSTNNSRRRFLHHNNRSE